MGVSSFFFLSIVEGLEPGGRLRGRGAEERKGKWGEETENMTEGLMLRCCC